jgi:hypothetical protein
MRTDPSYLVKIEHKRISILNTNSYKYVCPLNITDSGGRCIGSNCMAWVWQQLSNATTEPTLGSCGMVK